MLSAPIQLNLVNILNLMPALKDTVVLYADTKETQYGKCDGMEIHNLNIFY